ncbi:hypothetical protein GWI33_020252 [Rhynchophorus ferrugineus]|uniref:Uncharacterized protein n=1 Tax=Rhynchophorus ferrugineus TaxID=354439 RepID=A0A834HUN2_RHYFE|nr:hypothetical protein GWI33_020252 [Rhynchophorus ferrugineus]
MTESTNRTKKTLRISAYMLYSLTIVWWLKYVCIEWCANFNDNVGAGPCYGRFHVLLIGLDHHCSGEGRNHYNCASVWFHTHGMVRKLNSLYGPNQRLACRRSPDNRACREEGLGGRRCK